MVAGCLNKVNSYNLFYKSSKSENHGFLNDHNVEN